MTPCHTPLTQAMLHPGQQAAAYAHPKSVGPHAVPMRGRGQGQVPVPSFVTQLH